MTRFFMHDSELNELEQLMMLVPNEYKTNSSYQDLSKKKQWNTNKNLFSKQELSAEALTRIFMKTFNNYVGYEVNR